VEATERPELAVSTGRSGAGRRGVRGVAVREQFAREVVPIPSLPPVTTTIPVDDALMTVSTYPVGMRP
jgi:hypothetical protein